MYAYVEGDPISYSDPDGLQRSRSGGPPQTQAQALTNRINYRSEQAQRQRQDREREMRRREEAARKELGVPGRVPPISPRSPEAQRELAAEMGISANKYFEKFRQKSLDELLPLQPKVCR